MATRQQRKERITEQRKAQLLDAALAVFARKGYGEATMPDIAQEAGVAVGTIYNYYQSKRDLLVSIVKTYVITEPFVDLLEHSMEADDLTFVNSVIEDRLRFGFEDLERFLFLMYELQRAPDLREQFAEQVLGPVLELPERYLESRIASGAFRPLNARITVRAMVGTVIGFLLLNRIEGEASPCQGVTRQEVAAELVNFVLGGLRAQNG